MGGCTFAQTAHGRNVQEAYNNAVRDAQYEHGHGGYTGSIAEKDGFTVFQMPARVTINEFLRAMNDIDDERELTGKMKKIEALVRRAYETYDDKWGPAVALVANASEMRSLKESHRLKRTRKVVVYFCGWASS